MLIAWSRFSFYDLIRPPQQRWRDRQAEGLGGFEAVAAASRAAAWRVVRGRDGEAPSRGAHRRHHHLPLLQTICLYCKRIHSTDGAWLPVEIYVRDHSDAQFSHGPCAECMPRMRQQYRLSE
jgi:hypothetical protein